LYYLDERDAGRRLVDEAHRDALKHLKATHPFAVHSREALEDDDSL
jgi:hypothetical protein